MCLAEKGVIKGDTFVKQNLYLAPQFDVDPHVVHRGGVPQVNVALRDHVPVIQISLNILSI